MRRLLRRCEAALRTTAAQRGRPQKRHPTRCLFLQANPRLANFDALGGHFLPVEGQGHAQDAVGQLGGNGLHVHRFGQAESAGEVAVIGFNATKRGLGLVAPMTAPREGLILIRSVLYFIRNTTFGPTELPPSTVGLFLLSIRFEQ